MSAKALNSMRSKPLSLGTLLKSKWKIAAVHFIEGERYYFLINENGDISMMPADVVEAE